MKKIIIIGLALVSGAEAKAAWFCEDPYNSETCNERVIFERYRVKNHEKLKTTVRFTGLLEATTGSGNRYEGTAFLFETKKCPKNRFVMTNAHLKYDAKAERGDRVAKKARFCLDSLDDKSWSSCSPLNISEENILIGNGWSGKSRGKNSEDYLVAPFMEERPSSEVVSTLVTLHSDIENFNGFHLSGYNYKEQRMYLGTGCKNGGFSVLNQIGKLFRDIIPHSCPTKGVFSGAPFFYFDKNGKPKVFGVNVGQTLGYSSDRRKADWRFKKRRYSPYTGYQNYGLRISSDLINKINRYCESYLNRQR